MYEMFYKRGQYLTWLDSKRIQVHVTRFGTLRYNA